MNNWLILTHVVALAAWAWFTEWEIRANWRLIQANGSQDTLHEGFHEARSLLRLNVATGLGLAASLPLLGHLSMLLSFGALVLLFAGWFTYRFNPALSVARGKEADCVSFDPHAARFPDRLLALRATRAFPGTDALAEANRVDYAARELRWLRCTVLALAGLGYAAALVVLFHYC
ncbi:MAG: hypothetical protein NVS3B25_33510 [Hymenobacter sp.]